ncbi:Uncharacterized protein BP5553_04972 [Venustampulla echinocandica]|uniref:Uncharacterized protein n=1 Tax=Venustampulla echinocandica TaxID=2656787 RepID=A0A370TPU5_9HELO|nr:Uncharacterized protein BP5553_04972 [Venustampulla echinocandica]RDL37539.1 Uncharacterized protein BP5553_04972 [Venustampulla echinocandica]
MPKLPKTWILLRSTEYQPNGCLSLGQILLKPFEPSLPLLPEGPLPIPPSLIERSHQSFSRISSSSSLSGSFGFWASIDLLPVQAELSGTRSASESWNWSFDRLESETIVPRLVDVQAAMKREEIVRQINHRKFDFRKRLYMVTGIRVARGAKLSQSSSKSVGIDAKAGLDLVNLIGAPIAAGPKAGVKRGKDYETSFEGASDFVFAYRVCEVYYGKDVYVKPYNKGDTLGVHGGMETQESSNDEDEDEDEEEHCIIVEKIGASEYKGAGVAHQSFQLPADGSDAEEEELLVANGRVEGQV